MNGENITRRGHSTNLVGIPTGLLASPEFNEHPVPMHISGVRETNRGLFRLLDQEGKDPETAAQLFQNGMCVVYGLNPELRPTGANGRQRYRSSYVRLLKGWMFDSNNPEGAVLKGWVESRFGLFPTYHKQAIDKFSSPAWIHYVEEKMSSRFHNNAIFDQLDLLYEYCQWASARFFFPGRKHVTLYRGINDFSEHRVVARLAKREVVLRLNCLNSFTSERERACEFGDSILEVKVPRVKLLFFRDLLPDHPLQGEGEYLAIGGDFRVKVSSF
jgi:NAD+--dinitrogen-reductase ADP-D-ribosyltransferase